MTVKKFSKHQKSSYREFLSVVIIIVSNPSDGEKCQGDVFMNDLIKLGVPVRPFEINDDVTGIPVREILNMVEEADKKAFSILIDRINKRNERYAKLITLEAPEIIRHNEERLIKDAVEILIDNTNKKADLIDGNYIAVSLATYGYTIAGDTLEKLPIYC